MKEAKEMPPHHTAQLLQNVMPSTPETEGENAIPQPNAGKLSPLAIKIAGGLQTSVVSPTVLGGTVRLADLAIVAAFGFASLHSGGIPVFSSTALLSVAAALLLSSAFFQASDCYQIPLMRNMVAQAARMVIAWTLVFVTMFMAKTFGNVMRGVPGDLLILWYGFGLATLLTARMLVTIFVRKWTREGRLERRAVIVGGGQVAADFIHEIERQPNNDIRICGLFDDRKGDRSPDIVAGYPKLGTVSDLVEFARIARIDMLIVTIPLRAEKRLLEFLKTLWVLPVDIRLSAHTDKLTFRDRASSFIGTVPIVDVVHKPLAD